jgi:hypothetical protein
VSLLAYLPTALIVVSAVIAGASVALKAIAPLTKSVKDDRVLALLTKAAALLEKLSLNVR